MPLYPMCPITLVRDTGFERIPIECVDRKLVGEKAFGLASIPSEWTLPFIVIASELFQKYASAQVEEVRNGVVREWISEVKRALVSVGIRSGEPIWVRSSGVSETIADRGRLHSELSTFDDVANAIAICFQEISKSVQSSLERICLVIQRAVVPVSAKGHLSNERQYSKEARDWIGEIESSASALAPHFKINLRRWRRQENAATHSTGLACTLGMSIERALKPAAWWAYARKTRVHYEWVWNGRMVFLVQADEAINVGGFDPTERSRALQKIPGSPPLLKCLSTISDGHALKFNKIKNVEIYRRLGMPSCPIYVLDDPGILSQLASGVACDELAADLQMLCEFSLVIRTDIETQELVKRQLLPRTCEVRDPEEAVSFLKDTLAAFAEKKIDESVAFIFHNFIPSTSSAFAYAAPGTRKVHIECLWGLPEGLYYNGHDKIIVDTQKSVLSKLNVEDTSNFAISYKEGYKGFCVAPDGEGLWIRLPLAEPFDWKRTISKEEWIRDIALQSRRIAEDVGEPISIMWFVGVPSRFSERPTFPWYHEPYAVQEQQRQSIRRKKDVWDKPLLIERVADVERLKDEANSERSLVRQVILQPKDNELLRNRMLLETVGMLAKKLDAVIYLEGGTLSHAYYQLLQTKAQVDIAHPFDFSDETREFHKLVRDGIPDKIAAGGEVTKVAKLIGDEFIRALREKLVEEAVEALDAKGHDRLLEELADVDEVIDSILSQLKASRKELVQIKKRKRSLSGGFNDGLVLIATANPSRIGQGNGELDFFDEEGASTAPQSLEAIGRRGALIRRWEDQREHPSGTERVLNLSVGLTQDSWTTDSREIAVGDRGETALRARVTGRRDGAAMTIEISLFSLPKQLSLFLDENIGIPTRDK